MGHESMQKGEFAAQLLGLRTNRGMSGVAVARKAGIDRRTLSRWERGENQPSLPELTSVLDALSVSQEESERVIRCITAPRAQTRILQRSRFAIAGTTVKPPVGGDLLRALRIRRQKTQQDVARCLGITQATLARWENGQAWPSSANLHALCWELGAHLEEVKALTVGRFSPATCLEYDGENHSLSPPRTVEELQARLQHLRPADLPSGELGDLYTFAYIAAMWAMGAERTPRLLPYFAAAYSDRARFLMDAGRLSEAEEPARISLQLIGKGAITKQNIRSFVTNQLVLAERDIYGDGSPLNVRRARTLDGSDKKKRSPNYRWGINRLQNDLLSISMPWEYRTWVLAHAARYTFGAGDGNAAVDWAERAYLVIDSEDVLETQDQWARRELWMRLLIRTGRYKEAAVLPPIIDLSGSTSAIAREAASVLLLQAEALQHLGSSGEAQKLIESVQTASIMHGWETIRAQADNLGNHL